MKSKKILDVRVDMNIDTEYVLNKIEHEFLRDDKFHYICTTNPEFIMESQKNKDFKNIINNADLSVPDGAGVLMASSYLNRLKKINRDTPFFPIFSFLIGMATGVEYLFKRDSRITGVHLTEKICELSNKKGYSVFFLGGCPRDNRGNLIKNDTDLAQQSAQNMQKKYPNINIIGATSQFSPRIEDDDSTITYIKKCMKENEIEKLDFILVAYGQYHQEKWLLRNNTHIPVKVGIGVGRTFDYFSGYDKQPPKWTKDLKVSWIYSLIKQPWRFKRVVNAFPIFPFFVFLSTLDKSSIDIE